MAVELDLEFANLSKYQVLEKYGQNLRKLRSFALENNISEDEFMEYVTSHLKSLPEPRITWSERWGKVATVLERRRPVIKYLVIVLVICCLIAYKREISSYTIRNVQVYIYPGMKLWRRLTAPLILFFPSLTDLYDESCLIGNPFFQVDNLNCAPCSQVINILDLTRIDVVVNDNMPYMFKTSEQRRITLRTFNEIYHDNKAVFEKDAFKVKSTNRNIVNLETLGVELLNRTNRPESHSVWRCNRMEPARLIRPFFPQPQRFPKTGTSLERFLIFDTPEAKPYRIPDTECANVFLIQVTGNRQLVLMPTTECKTDCRTLSVRLPTSYVLKYNWWYYRPISLPDEVQSSNSVTYVGSYC